MNITARITKDAVVNTVKDDRTVTNFSVAINDRFKNAQGERKETATFFNCSYWLSDKVAPYLTKGTLVELTGQVGLNVWNNTNGEAKGALTFHVDRLKFHSKTNSTPTSAAPQSVVTQETADDLPF